MENIRLNNGLDCPVIGIGTFMLAPVDAQNSVREALKIKDNLDILDFTLTEEEMAEIAKLNNGKRYYVRTDAALAGFAGWQPTYEV